MHRSKASPDPIRQARPDPSLDALKSQLRSAQAELAQARVDAKRARTECRKLAQQTEARNRFLGTLSHELRSPLSAIIGFAELLGSQAVHLDSAKREELIGHIESSGRHLLRLIDDVLALSKIDDGRYAFSPEPVRLERLIAEALDVLHTRILRKRVVVQVRVDPALSEIVVDPMALKRALVTYVSNAVRFTPEGGRIAVRARPQGPQRFRLEVQDAGAGIAAEDQPGVFAGLAPHDAAGQRPPGDTGLELALTRRLVEAQGGQVGMHSAQGQGSTFWLVLDRRHPHAPRRMRVDEPAGQPEHVAAAGGSGPHTGGPG